MFPLLRRTKVQPLPLGDIPLGTIFKTEKGYFFVHSNTKRYRFTSLRAVASWAPQRILNASEEDAAVQKLRVVTRIKFRNGSLIWNLADGKIYLIESGKRRHVISPDALTKIGATEKDIMAVSLEEVNLHEPGEDFS